MSEDRPQETPEEAAPTQAAGVAVDTSNGSAPATVPTRATDASDAGSAAAAEPGPAAAQHEGPASTILPPRRRYASPAAPASRPRWWRILRVALLVILLPVLAFLVGLLIAWIVDEVRGSDSTVPRGSAAPSAAPASAAPSASATPSKAPAVVVPADWVTETEPPAGLTYRHPAGWVRRTALPEVLRFEPATPGSTAPGVEGVGAGIESAADPAQAAQDFATRNYGQQPGYSAAAVTAVAGAHQGEQQLVGTYQRSGVPVRVVIHAFRSGNSTVVVLGRAADAQPGRAGQLESIVEASLQVSG